jgi:hypothetical protein
VEVIDIVGTIREELPISEKVTTMEPCPEEGRNGLASVRASMADGMDNDDGTDSGSLGLDFGSMRGSGGRPGPRQV